MENKISEKIVYVGVNDYKKDLFEGQYIIPNGIAYNSYVIFDEKIAVFDTVDAEFTSEWLDNLEITLQGKSPDYLIISHMEPDHSANILEFTKKYPSAIIVSNAKTFKMIDNFFPNAISSDKKEVKEGEELVLGDSVLTFYFAPMVHWPEVMMTYEKTSKTLFSADAFGKFGALDAEEDWACEARRYYFGIVGKYGMQVQNVLKKLSGLEISTICPLHGPILKENLGYYLNLYNTWSSYGVESEGVCICYTSVYGNTKRAVELLAKTLEELGATKVAVNDLARCDMAEAVEDAFRYGKLVLATTTYNGEIFPFMKEFIGHLIERNYQNRFVGLIENGSWAPVANKIMKGYFEKSKNITFYENEISILSAVKEENKEKIVELAKEILSK
ncbi:MAG: FprA family A-type flavoprotein [Clostridia bacterium]|nr:FprA family A-type flavoprotein [Clostridia bacterium]